MYLLMLMLMYVHTVSLVLAGLNDSIDNCPLDINVDQANIDGDDLGDACECDIDGDGKNIAFI